MWGQIDVRTLVFISLTNQNIYKGGSRERFRESREYLQRASKPVFEPDVHWGPAAKGCEDPFLKKLKTLTE